MFLLNGDKLPDALQEVIFKFRYKRFVIAFWYLAYFLIMYKITSLFL